MIPNIVHSSWNEFLTTEILEELKEIESKIGNNYNPRPSNRILRFLSLDLKEIKCIFLGMDAYPAKESRFVKKEIVDNDINSFKYIKSEDLAVSIDANSETDDMVEFSLVPTGRSFEVGNLSSWSDKFRQVSLKNIVRLLHKNYNNIEDYSKIKKFSDIQKEIESGSFKILPPNKLFDSWEEQGVLCLNVYPTCEIGKPGSHKDIWHNFSIKLLNYISTTNPDISWFLWGKEAISHKEYILSGKIIESRHPMMCSVKYEDDFLKSNCFKDTMDKINWLGV